MCYAGMTEPTPTRRTGIARFVVLASNGREYVAASDTVGRRRVAARVRYTSKIEHAALYMTREAADTQAAVIGGAVEQVKGHTFL